jgi:hypothetical protein
MQKEVAMENFNILYRQVPGGSVENLEISDFLVSGLSFRLCRYMPQTKYNC